MPFPCLKIKSFCLRGLSFAVSIWFLQACQSPRKPQRDLPSLSQDASIQSVDPAPSRQSPALPVAGHLEETSTIRLAARSSISWVRDIRTRTSRKHCWLHRTISRWPRTFWENSSLFPPRRTFSHSALGHLALAGLDLFFFFKVGMARCLQRDPLWCYRHPRPIPARCGILNLAGARSISFKQPSQTATRASCPGPIRKVQNRTPFGSLAKNVTKTSRRKCMSIWKFNIWLNVY